MHTACTLNISPGVNLTCIQTDKFKTGCLSINLISSLHAGTAASTALLPRVLRRGSDELPDMERITSALDDLYGARIEPLVRKKGELHCIGFYSDFPDDSYIPGGGSVLEKTASFAGGMLLSPVMSGGLLRQDYIDGEKKNLIDDIRAGINDKRGYALDRLLEEMCADEAYGVNRLGCEAEASGITPESLTARYHELLSGARVELLYCGAADPKRVEAALLPLISGLPDRGDARLPETNVVLYPGKRPPVRLTEELDVSQGKLAVGFRLGRAMQGTPDYPAMMVFNAVYGSGVTSKLFLNVRERLALCYYAGSMLDKQKGVMIVSSGVDFSNYDVALDEILVQLENVRNGDVSEWELASAKSSVANAIKSAMDRPSGLMDLYFDSIVSPVRYDPVDLSGMVESVTLDRVVATAAEIEADTIYFLTGNGGGTEDPEDD